MAGSGPIRDTTFQLHDGRPLAYTEWGDPRGTPVLFLHGSPSTRVWSPDLYRDASTPAGVRLIVPDRPGFGGSDPLPGCTLGGWTSDVVELADALELPRFGIVGFSAGTPWAAACGALILERVTRIGIAHSRALAAYDFLERPEALEQLSDEDSHDYGLVRDLGPEAAADALIVQEEGWARDVAEHPARVMDGYPMPEGDRWLCDDPPLARFLLDGFRDAVRQGAVGMVWQFIAYVQAWGFRLADVSVPVDLWHGAQDPRVTMESQEFLVRTIPDARLTVWPDVGHFGIAKHWPEVLEAVTRPV